MRMTMGRRDRASRMRKISRGQWRLGNRILYWNSRRKEVSLRVIMISKFLLRRQEARKKLEDLEKRQLNGNPQWRLISSWQFWRRKAQLLLRPFSVNVQDQSALKCIASASLKVAFVMKHVLVKTAKINLVTKTVLKKLEKLFVLVTLKHSNQKWWTRVHTN